MAYVDSRVDTPFNEDDELAAIETFEDGVDATKSLINRLMTTKRTLRTATLIKSDIESLEDLMSSNPTQDYAASHGRLTSSFSALRLSVLDSTIRDNHPIHQELIQLQTRIESLSSKDKETVPSSSTSTTSHKPKAVHRHKLDLPTFSGDLMDWAAFWSQFTTAVDSDADLSEEYKLEYLRHAVKDTSLKTLLFSGAERKGLYAEVVALLKQRFDKPRAVHARYCATLTSLSAIKNTEADLLHFIDKATHAMAGLKHSGQDDLPSFLTSILTSCLPKALQVEWEILSQEYKQVPPFEEFLKFLLPSSHHLLLCRLKLNLNHRRQRPSTLLGNIGQQSTPTQLDHLPTQLDHHPTQPHRLLDSGMNVCYVQGQNTLSSLAKYLTK